MKTQFTHINFLTASCLLALCLMFFCTLFTHGQNTNFYSMVFKQDKYYDSLVKVRGSGNMQGTGYKPYLRWKLYWMSKVSNSGNQKDAYNAMRIYTENFVNIKNYFSPNLQSWNSLGPFIMPNNIPANNTSGDIGVGRIHALAFDPNMANRVYAMSPSWGGLYRSDNSGATWAKIPTDGVEGEGLGYLLVDHTNSNILYLVNGDSDGNFYDPTKGLSQSTGIYRSINGGNSWVKIVDCNSAQRYHYIRKIVMSPNNHDKLLSATDYGLYKINNASTTINDTIKAWDATYNCPMKYSFIDIEFRPGHNNEVYASGRHHNYLYKSVDYGDSWVKINNPFITSNDTVLYSNIEISASNQDTLYFLSEQKVPGYVNGISILYSYNINSQLWQVKDTLLYVSGLAKGFAISPTNPNLMFAGGVFNYPIYKSVNAGDNFLSMDKYYHVDIHHLDFSNTGELWAGTDGGIHKYNTFSDTWTDCTNMSISNIGKYSFSVSQSDSNYAIMGCYDNGSNLLDKSSTAISKWSYRDGGDGTACVFDYADANIFFTSTLDGKIVRQNRNDPNYNITLNPTGNNSKAYNSLAIDAGNDKLVYMITDTAVYRSYSQGDNNTWHNISGNLNTGNAPRSFYHLYTSPTTPGVLYLQNLYYFESSVNKIYHKMWRTFNANASVAAQVVWEPYTLHDTILFNDIVFDPNNPKRGCASIQGWSNPKKIMQFSETGWLDISYNLDSLVPVVVSLAYDRASSTSRLYAGTWDGIFYLDKGTTQWKLLDGMPEAEITNLEIQYISGKLFASTYGKGLWETNIRNTTCTGPVAITNDSTLLNGAMSLCDIIVKPGKTFTIKGLLTMGQNAKIVVERDAKLIVDGGKITGLPGFMWKGIEVWGDSSKSQVSTIVYQGTAKFINNAVVENAKTAVVTVRNDGTSNYAYTGAIVQGTDATFRNCTYGVVFHKYENKNPLNNKAINNASMFTRCIFETDNNYIGNDTIRNSASLSEVRGVSFYGCTFKNTNTSAFSTKATGLFSYNSSFSVKPTCRPEIYPCQIMQRNVFSGLRYGVRALGSATTKTFNVENADFTLNKCGLYSNAIDFAYIIQNTFYVTKQDTSITSAPAGGVYMDQCRFYTIEENSFSGVSSSIPSNTKYIGLTISNSGSDNNQVYKNTFNNLDIGILAQGKNRNPANNDGLCIRCNDFNSCKYDIAVTAPANSNFTINGVAKYQGSSTDPVGNLFTVLSQNPTYQFWNMYTNHASVPVVTYFHHANIGVYPRLRPASNKITNLAVSPTQAYYTPDISCPSHLNTNPNISDKLVYDNKADSIGVVLQQLIDEGNTDGLAIEVSNSFPDEALQLHDELIQNSPFVSDTVLQLAIEKENVLNNALLRDVLVANPQSAKSGELMDAVDQRWEPMPDYMKEEILEGSTIVSEKEKLEAERANYTHRSDIVYNSIINLYLHDTLYGYARDSAISLIAQSDHLTHRYLSAVIAAENNDTTLCNEILEGIASTWYSGGNLSDELLSTTEFFHLNNNIGLNNLPVNEIDSTQTNALRNLMDNYGSASTWARNMLIATDKISFTEEYILPDNLKSAEAIPNIKKKTIEGTYLKAFPNPSKDYVVFEYQLKDGEYTKDAILIISDNKGVVHEQLKLYRPVDQVVYITKNMKPGIYVCSLISGNAVLGNLKLSILK